MLLQVLVTGARKMGRVPENPRFSGLPAASRELHAGVAKSFWGGLKLVLAVRFSTLCRSAQTPAKGTSAMDDNAATQTVSHVNNALAQAGMSQRILFQEIGQFTRDESLRFANLRLERNGTLLDKFSSSVGVGGLIAAQQEWLRDMIGDYSAQAQRVAGLLRGMAHNAVASAAQSAGETVDRVHSQTREAMRQTAEALDEGQTRMDAAARDAVREADQPQETQH
jgi:hypothetical protein